MDITRIIVPVDYSEHARVTLEYAATLAKGFGAALDVIHVWDKPNFVPETTVVSQGGEPAQSLADLIRGNAEREMRDFLAAAKLPEGVTATHHLEAGEPVSAILEAIEHHKSDLVVMGTHGRTGARHLLLGSVAEKLVRLSPVAVITVPPVAR